MKNVLADFSVTVTHFSLLCSILWIFFFILRENEWSLNRNWKKLSFFLSIISLFNSFDSFSLFNLLDYITFVSWSMIKETLKCIKWNKIIFFILLNVMNIAWKLISCCSYRWIPVTMEEKIKNKIFPRKMSCPWCRCPLATPKYNIMLRATLCIVCRFFKHLK